jgi:hypothetical protein
MLRLLVTDNVVPSPPIRVIPDEGDDTFLQNIGSYKSHMV